MNAATPPSQSKQNEVPPTTGSEIAPITPPLTHSTPPLLKKAGLPHSACFHDLRHTCVTLLRPKNVNPKVVEEMLDHANISQTMDIYSHVLPNMQYEAASVMESALT
jgi:integrase